MKRILIAIAVCCLSLAASAQKETGFFVGAGAGMNFGFDGFKYEDRETSHNGAGWAGDFYAGGFLNESIGLRAGYQGFGISDRYTDFGRRKYNYVHGDVLLRAHRNIIPYVHGGWLKIVNPSFGGGAGIMFPIHLGEHVSIVPDFKATAYSSSAFNTAQKNIAMTLSATVGLAFRFGGKKQAKATGDTPVMPAMPVVGENAVSLKTAADTARPARLIRDTVVVREIVHDTVYVRPAVKDDAAAVKPLPAPASATAVVLFDVNSSEILPERAVQLDTMAEWLQQHPAAKALISGHTDNTASAAYNLSLSNKRALAVYIYLINKGVTADRLSYSGFGYDHPAATNDTAEGRQKNRRVEVVSE